MPEPCPANGKRIDPVLGKLDGLPDHCIPAVPRSGAYAADAALRMAGRSMPDFEHWLDTVASFDLAAAKEEPEEGNPTD